MYNAKMIRTNDWIQCLVYKHNCTTRYVILLGTFKIRRTVRHFQCKVTQPTADEVPLLVIDNANLGVKYFHFKVDFSTISPILLAITAQTNFKQR